MSYLNSLTIIGFVGAYRKRFGRHYDWNNLARKNLWNLARVRSAWHVMALWDIYLESESWWATRTGWSIYGMIRDTERLLDNLRFKKLAILHEEQLLEQRYGSVTEAAMSSSACSNPLLANCKESHGKAKKTRFTAEPSSSTIASTIISNK